jgi:preprotein translocase subunit SecD
MVILSWTGSPGRHHGPSVSAWRDLALAAALLLALAGCGSGELRDPFAFRVTYQAVPVDGASPTPKDMDVIGWITQSRLEATGLATLRVSVQEPDRVVVEAAPAGVLEAVKALAGSTGRLDFVPLGSTQMSAGEQIDLAAFPPLFCGDQVAAASIGTDQTGQRTVDFTLKSGGKDLFANYTADHIGQYVAIVLDGQVITAPVIQSPIPNGQIQITTGGIGGYPLTDAQNLVTILRFGQNPFPLREIQVEQR